MKATLKFVIFVLLGATALYVCLSLFAAACAHATVMAGAIPLVEIDQKPDWITRALAIATLVIVVADKALHWIAPRTKTTLDDSLRDFLDRLLAILRNAPPAPPEPLPTVRDPQSGRAALAVAVAMTIGLVAGSVGYTMLGCATVERAGGAAKSAVVECGKQFAPSAAALLARWGVKSAITGHPDWADIEQTALGLGEGAGVCAVAEFLNAWKHSPAPQVAALGGTTGVVAEGQAVLERLRAHVGGAKLQLVDGSE
ncbi:MAG TPA: hypothetical protein VJU58_10110, partial [Microbacterium sp.]|nr:hypothetical protein [Microbacterium sp.]